MFFQLKTVLHRVSAGLICAVVLFLRYSVLLYWSLCFLGSMFNWIICFFAIYCKTQQKKRFNKSIHFNNYFKYLKKTSKKRKVWKSSVTEINALFLLLRSELEAVNFRWISTNRGKNIPKRLFFFYYLVSVRPPLGRNFAKTINTCCLSRAEAEFQRTCEWSLKSKNTTRKQKKKKTERQPAACSEPASPNPPALQHCGGFTPITSYKMLYSARKRSLYELILTLSSV